MKENKVMAKEICQIPILHPKTSKEFYHHIKFWKSIMKRRCSLKIIVRKHFEIFTGKHLCQSIFSINFIKKELQDMCFPVNIARFLRAIYFVEHL